MPELQWYIDVETPLDPTTEIIPPADDDVWDGEIFEEMEVRKVGEVKLKDVKPVKMKRRRARRVSVSSSGSDVSISEVLKGVVKDYAATHSRMSRGGDIAEKVVVSGDTAREGIHEEGGRGAVGREDVGRGNAGRGDLICFD
jgi:hypothetical protein